MLEVFRALCFGFRVFCMLSSLHGWCRPNRIGIMVYSLVWVMQDLYDQPYGLYIFV